MLWKLPGLAVEEVSLLTSAPTFQTPSEAVLLLRDQHPDDGSPDRGSRVPPFVKVVDDGNQTLVNLRHLIRASLAVNKNISRESGAFERTPARSADWQSAVSQVGNLRHGGLPVRATSNQRFVENLRFWLHSPAR